MINAKKSLFIFIVIIVLFEGIAAVFAFKEDTWGDEGHFVETIKYFGDEISVKTFTEYNQMATPLTFLVYAAWGRVFNFELNTLRILSLLIAFITYLAFYYLLTLFIKDRVFVLMSSLFFVFHPYMIGFSVFIFTDMLPITASIGGLIAIQKKRPLLYLMFAITGILSRQYFVFFSGAVGFFFLLRYISCKTRYDLEIILASILSLLPAFAFFLLWGGPSPVNKIDHLYLDEAFIFHFEYLTLYVSQVFIYLSPLIVFRWKYFYHHKKILFLSLILSLLYFIFPVEACKASQSVDIFTVGYFHKFIRMTLGEKYEHIIFYLSFLLAWPVVLSFFYDGLQRIKEKTFDFILMLNISLISFLVIMPFSYLLWEKYFMPFLPLAIMQILLVHFEKDMPGKRILFLEGK